MMGIPVLKSRCLSNSYSSFFSYNFLLQMLAIAPFKFLRKTFKL